MNTAVEYRQRAARALRLAKGIGGKDAEGLKALAADYEKRAANLDVSPAVGQPQQQAQSGKTDE